MYFYIFYEIFVFLICPQCRSLFEWNHQKFDDFFNRLKNFLLEFKMVKNFVSHSNKQKFLNKQNFFSKRSRLELFFLVLDFDFKEFSVDSRVSDLSVLVDSLALSVINLISIPRLSLFTTIRLGCPRAQVFFFHFLVAHVM